MSTGLAQDTSRAWNTGSTEVERKDPGIDSPMHQSETAAALPRVALADLMPTINAAIAERLGIKGLCVCPISATEEQGAVVLIGRVGTYHSIQLALDAVQRFPGTEKIKLQVEVAPSRAVSIAKPLKS